MLGLDGCNYATAPSVEDTRTTVTTDKYLRISDASSHDAERSKPFLELLDIQSHRRLRPPVGVVAGLLPKQRVDWHAYTAQPARNKQEKGAFPMKALMSLALVSSSSFLDQISIHILACEVIFNARMLMGWKTQ